jgi:hypothetical protein
MEATKKQPRYTITVQDKKTDANATYHAKTTIKMISFIESFVKMTQD